MAGQHDIRRNKRKSVSTRAEVTWQDRLGNDKFVNARCFDISESGLRLEMPEALPVQSQISLRSIDLRLHGRAAVKHCTKHGTKFILGVEFVGGLRWKPTSAEMEERLREAHALASSS
jgi:PilZ domain-containing protein